ncbi:MAG: ATP-binding protein [Pseudohongiellaceae bacterium]
MNDDHDYKDAYEQQRRARERAETLLELRSKELFETSESLSNATQTLNTQQTQLVQQEKLASIGLLAAGIAHEINNPIGFIKSNLQTLEEYLSLVNMLFDRFKSVADKADADPEGMDYRAEMDGMIALAREHDLAFVIRDSLDSIRESLSGAERVQEIINNLKDFSRVDSENRRLCDLNEVIDSTLKLLANEVKYNCRIEKAYGKLPAIYGCNSQLNQIFLNIMINAIHAMGSGGTLTIRTEADAEQVHVHFIDTGPGIDEKDLPQIFDPFFTTKEIGMGTGLGLYVSHGIVKKHRGSIRAENEADGGAHFIVSLPVDMRRGGR